MRYSSRDALADTLRAALNDCGLPTTDKVMALAQVITDLGCALEEVKGPLTVALLGKIERDYYVDPTVGKALILQGAIMTAWKEEEKDNGRETIT